MGCQNTAQRILNIGVPKRTAELSKKPLLIYLGLMEKKKTLFPFVITLNPNLPDVGNIIRKHLFILQSNPKLEELFPRGSVILAFRPSNNLTELLSPSRFKTTEEEQTSHHNNGCFKCDRNRCDLCQNFFVESKSFPSFKIGKKHHPFQTFL